MSQPKKPLFSFKLSAASREKLAAEAQESQAPADAGESVGRDAKLPLADLSGTVREEAPPGEPSRKHPPTTALSAGTGTPITQNQNKSPGYVGKAPRATRHGNAADRGRPDTADWDPAHFRLFVGNLGPDVTTKDLEEAFSAYPSMSKARVVEDKSAGALRGRGRSRGSGRGNARGGRGGEPGGRGVSRGYGFVAFASSDDYFQAFRDKNGKYIGSQPVQLKRAETAVQQRGAK